MMNPMQLIQMIQSSGNPMQMLNQMGRQNPTVGQVIRMMNGKTPDEMRNMAYQAAKERGVDLNQLANQMGIKLPE